MLNRPENLGSNPASAECGEASGGGNAQPLDFPHLQGFLTTALASHLICTPGDSMVIMNARGGIRGRLGVGFLQSMPTARRGLLTQSLARGPLSVS